MNFAAPENEIEWEHPFPSGRTERGESLSLDDVQVAEGLFWHQYHKRGVKFKQKK